MLMRSLGYVKRGKEGHWANGTWSEGWKEKRKRNGKRRGRGIKGEEEMKRNEKGIGRGKEEESKVNI
jgi:hypothetical protein